MKRNLTIGAATAAVCAVVVASPVHGAVATALSDALGLHGSRIVERSGHSQGDSLLAAAAGSLTASQSAAALATVASSPTVKRLFKTTPYRVEHSGPWMSGGEHNHLVGVVFFVSLERPLSSAGAWPVAIYPTHGSSYTDHKEYVSFDGVRAARVQVDLTRRAVVTVIPTQYAHASAGRSNGAEKQ